MKREDAYNILTTYLTNKNLIKHCLATESTMRALAKYFGDDEEKWGIVGLLHDADYELSKENPDQHGLLLFEKETNIPEDIAYSIKSHNYYHTNVMPKSKMDWAITCCDELTGLIIACALIHAEKKLSAITPEFIVKRFNTPSFAKNVNRDHISQCEEKLGIPLLTFITLTLSAMQHIHKDLGL